MSEVSDTHHAELRRSS